MEEVKLYMDNILKYICDTLENVPVNSKISRLQYNIPSLQNRIADLTEEIGVGYLAFDSHINPYSVQKKKGTLQKLQPPSEQE